MTDKELYNGIAEKNNETFLYLYEHHIDSIINLVKKNNGIEQDAKDIFQEGMVALWINVKNNKYNLESNTKLSTYLYSICRNLWYKKLRSNKKVVSIDSAEELSHDPSFDEHTTSYDRIDQLRAHFKQLGDKCQVILNLFYYKKASIKDIALHFNYAEKTAKNEKYRCMQRLRKMYN